MTDQVYLSLAHDFSHGGYGFVAGADIHTLERFTSGEWTTTQIWATGYGKATDAQIALLCHLRWQQIGDDDYRNLILAAAARYLESEPDPGVTLYPESMAHAILLMLRAYDMSDDVRYLQRAEHFADGALGIFFADGSCLPKASSQHDHYEAITGGDNLTAALLQLWAARNRIALELPLVFNAR